MSSLKPSVLILDNADAKCADIIRNGGCQPIEIKEKLGDSELIAKLIKCDAVVVRSRTSITAKVIDAVVANQTDGRHRLRIIGRAGVGVDNIEVAAATRAGIRVVNAPQGNSISAAELTCILMSSLARSVCQSCASLKQNKWEKSKFVGFELAGKTLAVIGLGRIGREVATRMQSFGMITVGYDPLVSREQAAEFGVEWLPLEQLWPRAHFITVHTPLIPQTKHLICAKTLAQCQAGVRIINVARGGIVHEADLLQALQSGRVAAAAFDVFEEEPPTPGSTSAQLIAHENFIGTPHLGANTKEAQQKVAMEIAEQMAQFFATGFDGRRLSGQVNKLE